MLFHFLNNLFSAFDQDVIVAVLSTGYTVVAFCIKTTSGKANLNRALRVRNHFIQSPYNREGTWRPCLRGKSMYCRNPADKSTYRRQYQGCNYVIVEIDPRDGINYGNTVANELTEGRFNSYSVRRG